jgi:Asp-tRNA(Asn)/Glu-tRNA(Gln) amidotransferase B subunit
MTDEQRWQLMCVLVPPLYLGAIIGRVQDGTISHANAKIVFNEVYETNRARLLEEVEE